jgi:hypothetical protein
MGARHCQGERGGNRGNDALSPPVSPNEKYWERAMQRIPTYAALFATVTLFAPSLCVERAMAGTAEQTAPQGEDPPGAENGPTPPLKQQDGVIEPPPTGDEEIHTEAPNPEAGHPEEVIPPPGSPGGDPNVEPR